MKTYYEKLKDPRWQKKRLEILNRANFACEECGDAKSTLHVHHGYYESGRDPWEYENDTLHCLCECCHILMQEWLRDLHYEMSRLNAAGLQTAMFAILEIRSDPQNNSPGAEPAESPFPASKTE